MLRWRPAGGEQPLLRSSKYRFAGESACATFGSQSKAHCATFLDQQFGAQVGRAFSQAFSLPKQKLELFPYQG
jgi:hypothetical protein